jgi:predicted aconitase with swiveling domain
MRILRGLTVNGTGTVVGELVAIKTPISFLGDVDGIRGVAKVGNSEVNIAGKVLVRHPWQYYLRSQTP